MLVESDRDVTFPRKTDGGLLVRTLIQRSDTVTPATEIPDDDWTEFKRNPVIQALLADGTLREVTATKANAVKDGDETITRKAQKTVAQELAEETAPDLGLPKPTRGKQ